MGDRYRAAEVTIDYPDGHPSHCVTCHKRYHDSAGARAVELGMRALTGWSYLARAQAAIAAVAVCRGMRRLTRGED